MQHNHCELKMLIKYFVAITVDECFISQPNISQGTNRSILCNLEWLISPELDFDVGYLVGDCFRTVQDKSQDPKSSKFICLVAEQYK